VNIETVHDADANFRLIKAPFKIVSRGPFQYRAEIKCGQKGSKKSRALGCTKKFRLDFVTRFAMNCARALDKRQASFTSIKCDEISIGKYSKASRVFWGEPHQDRQQPTSTSMTAPSRGTATRTLGLNEFHKNMSLAYAFEPRKNSMVFPWTR